MAGVLRATWDEWLLASLLAANLVWTTLCLGGYRPETMGVTLLLTGALLVGYLVLQAREVGGCGKVLVSEWLLLAFVAYGLANVMLITPVRWLGWLDWLGWANTAAVFWVVRRGLRSPAPRQLVFWILVMLGITAVVLASYQRFIRPGWLMMGRTQVEQFLDRASGPFGIPNSLAAFLLLLLPVCGALTWRRHATAVARVWWAWVTLVLGAGLLLTVSRGGWLALALALVVWPLTTSRWPWRRRAAITLTAIALLTVAGTILYQFAPGARTRLDRLITDSGELSRPILWRAAGAIVRENPLVGSGAGSFAVKFEQQRPAGFSDDPQWVHNEYLNTLSDYGAVGLVLFVGAVTLILCGGGGLRPDEKRDPKDFLAGETVSRGLAIGGFAFAVQAFVDFHFKIPALAMAFGVVAALRLGPVKAVAIDPSQRRSGIVRAAWFCAAVLLAAVLVPMAQFYRGEALRYRSRQALEGLVTLPPAEWTEALVAAEADLRRATRLAPSHPGAWADLALARELQVHAQPDRRAEIGPLAADAAQRATELGAAVPEFWIRLGVARDMQGASAEAEKAFEKSVRLAPRNSRAWYYYAHHLSRDTNQRAAALRAIATCLSLDPGNRAAEALRVKVNERSSGASFNP